MNAENIARIIYAGLRKHGLEMFFDCQFDELPREYKGQLLSIAASIQLPDPYEKLSKFKSWQHGAGGYQHIEAVDRFCKMEERNENQAE